MNGVPCDIDPLFWSKKVCAHLNKLFDAMTFYKGFIHSKIINKSISVHMEDICSLMC